MRGAVQEMADKQRERLTKLLSRHARVAGGASMRYLILSPLVAIFLACSACADFPASQHAAGLASNRLSDCPELEGYPDCQDGHHVQFALASQEADSTAR